MKGTKFINFWTDLFLRPKDFFKNNLVDSTIEPAYFPLAIIVFGIAYGIDRLDRQLMKYDLKGKLDDLDILNNWIGYWIFAIIGGILGGYILYLIGAWFFNVRLKWSNGTGDIEKSRYIYLYSGVISSSVIIFTTLVSMFISNKPYDPEAAFKLWDFASLVALIFFVYYAVYVSYIGVQTITDADKVRSKIWFLYLPFLFYTLSYITVFILIYNYVV